MHFVVCIKQVPDTTDVKIDPKTNTLMREGVAVHHQPVRHVRHRGEPSA